MLHAQGTGGLGCGQDMAPCWTSSACQLWHGLIQTGPGDSVQHQSGAACRTRSAVSSPLTSCRASSVTCRPDHTALQIQSMGRMFNISILNQKIQMKEFKGSTTDQILRRQRIRRSGGTALDSIQLVFRSRKKGKYLILSVSFDLKYLCSGLPSSRRMLEE